MFEKKWEKISNSLLLPHKGSFVSMIFFSAFHVGTHKMVWNFQKSGLEKTSGWMCVRACVCWDFVKIKSLYLRNYSADRIEIWYGGKAKVSLSSVSFLSQLISGLRFYGFLNFLKNVCKVHRIKYTLLHQLYGILLWGEHRRRTTWWIVICDLF